MQAVKIYENGSFIGQYENLWLNLCSDIANSPFHSRDNFVDNQTYDLANHVRIDLLFNSYMAPIAMSGVYKHPTWPNRVYRTHSRLWFSGYQISNEVPELLIGPVHRELKNNADALFVSFNGSTEESAVDIFLNYHAPLWEDGLIWYKATNFNIPNNFGTTILYSNINSNFNFLQNFNI